MNVMRPCLLSVSGIQNSKIIQVLVSSRRNNAIKNAELVLYQTSPPGNVGISYGGGSLFTGRITSVIRQPCGRIIARYESPPPPSIAETTLFLPLYFFVYNWSPVIAGAVNDQIQSRTFNSGAVRPVPPQELFFPQGLASTYVYVHPAYYNIRWRVFVWCFVGDKNTLLQESTWYALYPPFQQAYGLGYTLASIFGSFSDDAVIYGSFIVVEETTDGTHWYWIAGYWHPQGQTGISKVVADSSFTSLVNSSSFAVHQRHLDTIADMLETLGLDRAGQNARLVKEVVVRDGSNALELLRQYCKGITLRAEGTSYNVVDTLSIGTKHPLAGNAVFDFSLPRARYVNVEVEYEPTTGNNIYRHKQVRGITFPNAIDTVKLQTQEYISDSEYFQRTVRQVLEDVQETGSIRTVLMPSIEAYDIVHFAGGSFRVVGFTHEISAQGAFTNVQIIPEV